MKLYKRGRFYHAQFNTATGRKSVPTKATTLAEAKVLVKDSGLASLEQAGKSGALSQQAIGRITTGGKLTITKALTHYAKWMASIGRSPKTIDNGVTTVAAWAREAKVESHPPASIDEHHLSQWINQEGDAKASTRLVKLAQLRSFFSYCAAKGWTVGDPARLVRINLKTLSHAQKEAGVRAVFEPVEVRRLKAELQKEDDIFWLFAVTISNEIGLRLGDICQLEWDCFNTPNRIVVWTDKRDKRISVPISEELNDLLTRIPVHSPKYLFPEAREIINDLKRRSLLSVRFKRIVAAASITGKSFHCLRHTCVTRWAKEGRSLESIGKDVGHSDTKTTKGYVHE